MIIASVLLLASAVPAEQPVFDAPKLPEDVLAQQRGGLRLPNGIDIALAVQTQTAVNGVIVLRTVVRIDEGPPRIAVFTSRDGQPTAAGDPSGVGTQALAGTSVQYDSRFGLRVTRGSGMPGLTVSTDGKEPGPTPPGLRQVDLAQPFATQSGVIRATSMGRSEAIELSGSDLYVRHVTNNAFGSIIANSGNDRVIDTQTSIFLDLNNAGPDVLGSAMLRVENIGIEALTTRM